MMRGFLAVLAIALLLKVNPVKSQQIPSTNPRIHNLCQVNQTPNRGVTDTRNSFRQAVINQPPLADIENEQIKEALTLVEIARQELELDNIYPSSPRQNRELNLQTQVTLAEINLNLASAETIRMEALANDGVISQQQLGEALYQESLAREKLEILRNRLLSKTPQPELNLQNRIEQAQIELKFAQIRLQRTQLLVEEGVVPRLDLLGEMAQVETARVNLEKLQSCLID